MFNKVSLIIIYALSSISYKIDFKNTGMTAIVRCLEQFFCSLLKIINDNKIFKYSDLYFQVILNFFTMKQNFFDEYCNTNIEIEENDIHMEQLNSGGYLSQRSNKSLDSYEDKYDKTPFQRKSSHKKEISSGLFAFGNYFFNNIMDLVNKLDMKGMLKIIK